MQKATIRLLKKMEETPERLISQYTFVNKENISSKVYPIPKEISGSDCEFCKEESARFTIQDGEEFRLIGLKCFNQKISSSELKTEKALVFPSLEKSIKSSAFEWSPTGESWYKIHGRNILPDSTIPLNEVTKQKRFLEIMEKVLLGEPQTVDCDYNKDEKKFVIFV